MSRLPIFEVAAGNWGRGVNSAVERYMSSFMVWLSPHEALIGSQSREVERSFGVVGGSQ